MKYFLFGWDDFVYFISMTSSRNNRVAGWIHPISVWLVLQRARKMKYRSTWKAAALSSIWSFSSVYTQMQTVILRSRKRCESLFCLGVTLHSTRAPCLCSNGEQNRSLQWSEVKWSAGLRVAVIMTSLILRFWQRTERWKKGSWFLPTAVEQQFVSCSASSEGGLDSHCQNLPVTFCPLVTVRPVSCLRDTWVLDVLLGCFLFPVPYEQERT